MEREQKTFSFEVKAVDEEEGTFEGYAATFSKTPDSYGDVIEKGAFTKTLKERFKRIKILWNHYILEPIGKPLELNEDDKGLFVKGKLSLGVQRAKEVLALMKDGVITEMSIGYDAIKAPFRDGIRHLEEIRLWDVSPVVFAANPDAVVTGVKQAELKPFPNEHACRLRNPDDFQEGSFRRTTRTSDGKKYSVIMGRLEGEDTLTEQAYRYDKEVWEAADAKTHCKDHDGTFEAAEKLVVRVGKEPLPNFHTCKLRELDDFKKETIRALGDQVEGKRIHIILGTLKDEDKVVVQSFRYPVEEWEEEDAQKHCKAHEGKLFEAAEKQGKSGRVLSSANMEKVRAALEAVQKGLGALQALLEAAESEPEPAKAILLSEEAAEEAAKLETLVTTLKAENEGVDTKEAEERIEAILEKLRK